jgi:transcriptional regulator with XRE-family HTH domain
MERASHSVGTLLRLWRRRRGLSQLTLSLDVGVSQRHLSFVESGRSAPSREVIERLAERLSVPLRDRNTLLLSAGLAPMYRERGFHDAESEGLRQLVQLVLRGHEPYPALAIDRHWTLVAANESATRLVATADASLLTPPVNVLRLSLHPRGLAPIIRNLGEWRAHIFMRLARQLDHAPDAALASLVSELKGYPAPANTGSATHPSGSDFGGVAVPLVLETPDGILSFVSTTTVFGTPVEVSLSELAIESFFPADEATAAALRRRHAS